MVLRRFLCCLILAFFLFNVVGYHFFFEALVEKANYEIDHRLDDGDYDENHAVTIKIPLTMPYPLNKESYERAKGSFEWEGISYKVVKNKLENDTLYVVAVKNLEEQRLGKLKKDFVEASTDQPSSSKQHSKVPVNPVKDYTLAESLTGSMSLRYMVVDAAFTPTTERLLIRESRPLLPPPKSAGQIS